MYRVGEIRWRLGHVAYGIVLVFAGASLAGCSGAGATITRLTVGQPGPDACQLVSNTDQQNVKPKQSSGGQQSGDTAGLYGGTRRASSCDRDKLIAFLRENPDKARAWAAVRQISAAEIPAYVSRLTPVILRTDTLVTNYGYRN